MDEIKLLDANGQILNSISYLNDNFLKAKADGFYLYKSNYIKKYGNNCSLIWENPFDTQIYNFTGTFSLYLSCELNSGNILVLGSASIIQNDGSRVNKRWAISKLSPNGTTLW